jgi:hypothetical protein
MTPEPEQRSHDLALLTDKWGKWYRIWLGHGLWWASRDGDKLAGDSPAALESLLCDHMAICKARTHPSDIARFAVE